jgi:hypothetical protein
VNGNSRAREVLKSIGVSGVLALATLTVLEVALRIADLRELRETLSETSLAYDFDAELGWMPVPGSVGTVQSFRTTHYKHNSLGLRDEEVGDPDAKPTILFLGFSMILLSPRRLPGASAALWHIGVMPTVSHPSALRP